MTEQPARYRPPVAQTPADQFSFMVKQSRESSDFHSRMNRVGLSLTKAKEIILNDQLSPPIQWMLFHPERFTPQLALIMSIITSDDIPDADFSRINIQKIPDPVEIIPFHKTWDLCADAEPRLLIATDTKRATTIVDQEKDIPYMVVKDYGLLTGLCIQNVVTPDGNIMMQGCFYSPVDTEVRESIQEAVEDNAERIHTSGTWAYMRPLHSFGDYPRTQVLQQTRNFAEKR